MFNSEFHMPGFDLYQPFPDLDQWVFDLKNGSSFHGSLNQTVKLMCNSYGFFAEDVVEGLEILEQYLGKDHNGVHFGAMKSCIFTFEKKIEQKKVA
jgi:hypothetical protein